MLSFFWTTILATENSAIASEVAGTFDVVAPLTVGTPTALVVQNKLVNEIDQVYTSLIKLDKTKDQFYIVEEQLNLDNYSVEEEQGFYIVRDNLNARVIKHTDMTGKNIWLQLLMK
ncbi:hypothetical protein P7H50_09465 [Enterococcus durans]|uniref:hypothetical protein n=1 Tax=Enterococcus TaxID=1350 RepID=UPI00288D8CEE|nr:hypothetical protein [Enterococcus durans]MDT2837112.1 hypothetical protein [Enterococcus durans]